MIHTPARFVILCEGAYGAKWRSRMAEDLGISATAIWNYENGKRRIPEMLWDEVCAALCRTKAKVEALHAEYCPHSRCEEKPSQPEARTA